jgi:hypothetical protein
VEVRARFDDVLFAAILALVLSALYIGVYVVMRHPRFGQRRRGER